MILDWASLRAMTVSARLVAKMEVILEDEAPYVGSAAMVDIVAWCAAEEFGIEVLVEKVGVDGMLPYLSGLGCCVGITSLSPALIVFSSFGAEYVVENLCIYIFSHLFTILNQYNFIYWLKWFLFCDYY